MPENENAIVNAGTLIGEPKRLDDGGAYALVPEGATVRDLTEFLPSPAYARAAIKARTQQSLVDYVKRHKTDNTAIFADVSEGVVVGVIDYHSATNDPAHMVHRVNYVAPVSQEWKVWTDHDGKKLPQADFARFIEENRVDIVSPDGASILEIARSLDARKKVSFKSAVRLDDGTVDLAFSEETTNAGGGISGKVSIPTEIEIGIPVFYGGARYKMTAFFRYRIEDGRLIMWIDLHRRQQIRDHAFSEIVDGIRASCEGVPVYEAAI